MKKKPNVVFLFSDQHSANVLGCYGNQQVHTPNLDKLAQGGVRCTKAYTQNPVCTPSRMSYFTGQYVHNFGYYGLMGPGPKNLPNMISHFKKSGYNTGLIGKIHTPTGWLSKDSDVTLDSCDHEHVDHRNDYHDYLKNLNLLELSEHPKIPEWSGPGQGLDSRPSNLDKAHSKEQWIANNSLKFIDDHKDDDEPFFLFVSTGFPHQTYTPSQEFWDLYDEDTLELPTNANDPMTDRFYKVQEKLKFFEGGGLAKPEWTIFEPTDYESARRRVHHGYYACVSQMDDVMGQVLNKLDEYDLREDTIIVYGTDHGEFAGEHGMIEKAPGIGFECVTRIPLIWSYGSKLPKNHECDELVEAVDVFPTLCKLAEIEAPNYCDGKDIINTLTHNEPIRDIAVTENPLTKTVHTKEYKLVYYIEEMTKNKEFGELYDVINDPYELKNLYFDEAYQSVVMTLKNKLLQWIIKTNRIVTTIPMLGSQSDSNDATDLFDEDGKFGFETISQLIGSGEVTYL